MKNILPIVVGLTLALMVFIISVWYFNLKDNNVTLESPINLTEATRVKFKKFESPTNLAAFDELKITTASTTGIYGIYIKSLDSGQKYKYNVEELFYGASLYKLPIAVLTLNQAQGINQNVAPKENIDEESDKDVEKDEAESKIKLEDEVEYTKIDFTDGSGSIAESDFGTKYTIEELLNKLLKESDNVAQNMLIRTLTEDLVEKEFARLSPGGENSKYYDENQTSPAEIVGVLEKAFGETAVGFSNIFSIMSETEFDSSVHAGLKEETVFSHKIGTFGEKGVWHDCGIVLSKSPTIVCVMSKDTTKEDFANISKLTGEFVQKYVLY